MDVASIDKALSNQEINVFYGDDEGRLARGSADDLAKLNKATKALGDRYSEEQPYGSHADDPETQRPAKRKREATPRGPPGQMRNDEVGMVQRMDSRDAMPPPQLPLRTSLAMQTPQPQGDLSGARNDGRNFAYATSSNVHTPDSRVNTAIPSAEARNRQQGPSARHAHRQANAPAQRQSNDGDMYDNGAIFYMEDFEGSSHCAQDAQQHLPAYKHEPCPYGNGGNREHPDHPTKDNLYYPSKDSLSSLGSFEWPVPPFGAVINQPGQALSYGSGSVNRCRSFMEGHSSSSWSQDGAQASTLYENNLLSQSYSSNRSFNASRGPEVSPPNPSQRPYGQSFHSALPTNDGELDNLLQPMPQRPIYRSASISPTRGRITLPPTPRNTSAASSRSNSNAGLLTHVRSSNNNAHIQTPRRTTTHRQQLGLSGTTDSPVSASPFFAPRNISPSHQHQSTQRPSSIASVGSGNTNASQYQDIRSLYGRSANPYSAPPRHARPFDQDNPTNRHHHVHSSIVHSQGQVSNARAHAANSTTSGPPGEGLGSRYMSTTSFTSQSRQPSARMDPQVLNSLSFLDDPAVGNQNVGGRRKARR